MVIKTFNVDASIYEEYIEHCKKNGISMSKQIENFIKHELTRIQPNGSGDKKAEGHHSMGKYC